MKTERKIKKAMLNAIARGENRSPLFWWMVENHDDIAGAVGSRIHWKTVTDKAAAFGLTDTTGKPATQRNARETWRQARAAVLKVREKANAEAGKPKSKAPSRMSPDWRPQEVIPPPPIRSTAPLRSHAASTVPTVGDDSIEMTPEGQAEIDRVLAQLAEIDRKKFRFGG